MPTIRGWAALGAAGGLVLLWVGFGERLLLSAGLFLFVLVGLGLMGVRRAAPRVVVKRRISPAQIHDGDRAVVQVTLSSRRRIRHLGVEDDVAGLGSARFVATRVLRDEPVEGRYEVLCRPRGVYRVGPARVIVRDPLSLAETGAVTGKPDRLVVFPAVEDLVGLPLVRGHDPSMKTAQANFSHTGGEDFFTLRQYQRGDDLRRVHWPSSARKDELMIRQLEMPWQSRALILLDRRSGAYDGAAAFEHAVRGTASALRHLYRAGFSPTLWTGTEGTWRTGTGDYIQAMERLATVRPEPQFDLATMATRLRHSGLSGGALVLVTGAPDERDLATYRILGRDFIKTIVLSVTENGNDAILLFQRAGAVTVTASAAERWAPAWKQAMEASWSTVSAG